MEALEAPLSKRLQSLHRFANLKRHYDIASFMLYYFDPLHSQLVGRQTLPSGSWRSVPFPIPNDVGQIAVFLELSPYARRVRSRVLGKVIGVGLSEVELWVPFTTWEVGLVSLGDDAGLGEGWPGRSWR